MSIAERIDDVAALGSAAFDAVRKRLRGQGWLSGGNASTEGAADVIMLASRRSGEGVTTLTLGLAESISRSGSKPVLVILATNEMRAIPEKLEAGISAAGGLAIDMVAVPRDAASFVQMRTDISAAMPRLRQRYRTILIDVGSLMGDAAADWRPLADRGLMVIDLAETRREALEDLRNLLNTSVIGFDGFIGNRRRFFLPERLYEMLA